MKSLRFLAAGAALFLLASCGKEYNSVPGGNLGDNPLLPLGTADAGQIRYLRGGTEKIRMYNAVRNDTLVGTTSLRQLFGTFTATDGSGKVETLSIQILKSDTTVSFYTNKDSLAVTVSFTDPADLTGANTRIYTNQMGGYAGVNFTQQDAKVLRGTFYGRLVRQSAPADTGDVVKLASGTFWVQK